MKLGIIGAMDVEVAALKECMTAKVERTVAGSVYCEGRLEGLPAVVVQCGVGKVNAALCVQALCDCFGVTHIVNTGVAGSLNARLDIGDFVISREAMYHDFDCSPINPAYAVGQVPGLPVRAFPADGMLAELAFSAANTLCPGHAHMGMVASGDQFVCNKVQKQMIIENTGALCTEMEGAAIAHGAWRNGIPFVVIRAISDKADDSAEMDYPTFEAIAAKRCAEVTKAMAKAFAEK
ncbi:MAG: 5'-methylthioadenosine/adenosylhomocysteine nucleosidase [Oscillospiraceae bacterium]|nr:5'-methylthioadenosine/adenosylhomocysteine nucleosidase [Oscillospiraceae bacterium]